jgi:hypothetical protein
MPVRDLRDDGVQIMFDPPLWKVPSDLGYVADVADMVTDPVRRLVAGLQRKAHASEDLDGFQDGDAILASAPKIVHLATTGISEELKE